MTYSLDRGLFIEDGPAIHAASVSATRDSTRFRAWRKLDLDRRLDLVERALKVPANDGVDSFPIAL